MAYDNRGPRLESADTLSRRPHLILDRKMSRPPCSETRGGSRGSEKVYQSL
jgi:hypothetical protein